MEITIGTTDIKPIFLGIFTVIIFNVLSVFPVLLSPAFMAAPSLVLLAPLPPASVYIGMLVTVALAKENRKRQVIYMILALQIFLFFLNLIRVDAPRPLLNAHYQGAGGGIYMLLCLATNTPVYILFGLFTAWFYENFLGNILKNLGSTRKTP